MPLPRTIVDILATGDRSAPTLMAPGRPHLSYEGLRGQVGRTIAALNGLGAGRNDAIAIVLPNGPEMASAFVSIAAAGTAAPLNPAYRAGRIRVLSARPRHAPARGTGRRRHAGSRGRASLRCRNRDSACPARCGGRCVCAARGAGANRRGRSSGASRRGAGAAHVGDDLATQDRPAHPGKRVRLGHAHCREPGADAGRPVSQHHAALSHPWPGGGRAEFACRRCQRGLHAGLQCAAVLCPARGAIAHLVHRRTHHAPGDRRPRRAAPGRDRRAPVAADSFLVGPSASPGDGGGGRSLRRAGDRGLRHDGGRSPDGQQPAPAPCEEARQRRRGGGPRDRDHGRYRERCCPQARQAK